MELPLRIAAFFLYVMGLLIILYAFFLTVASALSSELSSLNIFFNLLVSVSIGISEIVVASLLLKQLKKA